MTRSHQTVDVAGFELLGLHPGTGSAAELTDDTEHDWVPAIVPGGVHESLLAAGRIIDPYLGGNERVDGWIDEREWWFRATFPAPAHETGDRVRLVFDGLDTVADVWLNQQPLGHHENQFRPAEVDVTGVLTMSNTVLVRFTPPLLGRQVEPSIAETERRIGTLFAAMAAADPAGAEPPTADGGGPTGALLVGVGLRKAAFSWGWDFGPNLPSIGIWRSVRLSVEPGPVVRGHQIAMAELSADRRTAEVELKVESEPGAARARIRLTAPSGRVTDSTVALVDGTGRSKITITDPELWWTHDLGAQNLYDVRIELLDAQHAVTDVVDDRIGLRTIRLDLSPDEGEGGRHFRFLLNGLVIFARGAAWLPASMFVGSVSPQTYHDRVRRARAGNLTMLRIWGGGVYEHDAFYTACDELGVLVWQDFMFACMDYPSALPALRAEVALEAAYQVRRLRNRASLALWCGNNEVQMLHAMIYGEVDPGEWGWPFFHELLPAVVERDDGHIPYWPGSPWGDAAQVVDQSTRPTAAAPTATAVVGGALDGDKHSWEVWHGMTFEGEPAEHASIGDARHYRRYLDDRARFVSEFGIHAAPELATLQRWIPADELAVHSPTFDLHNKDNPKNKGDELLAVTTGLPTSLTDYVWFTQAVQAEGMALAIAHYRRRQPHCGGALMWQFNDVWPGITWSVIDYDGVPKSSYYAAARASAPVVVSFADRPGGPPGTVDAWLVNNSADPVELEIMIEIGAFDASERNTTTVTARAGLAEAVVVWSGVVPQDARHYVWAESPTSAFPAARLHFAEIGELETGPSALAVQVRPEGLVIGSTGYSYSVRIEQPEPGIWLSDNCFDLRDGEERLVTVSGIDPARLAVSAYPRT